MLAASSFQRRHRVRRTAGVVLAPTPHTSSRIASQAPDRVVCAKHEEERSLLEEEHRKAHFKVLRLEKEFAKEREDYERRLLEAEAYRRRAELPFNESPWAPPRPRRVRGDESRRRPALQTRPSGSGTSNGSSSRSRSRRTRRWNGSAAAARSPNVGMQFRARS